MRHRPSSDGPVTIKGPTGFPNQVPHHLEVRLAVDFLIWMLTLGFAQEVAKFAGLAAHFVVAYQEVAVARLSKLLVSPLITPIVVPYRIPYITPL